MGGIARSKVFRIVGIPLILALVLFWASTSRALTDELAGIRAAIESKGARWIAGETSVSKLLPEERMNLLGLIEPEGLDEEWATALDDLQGMKAAALPLKLDWRSYNGGSYVTPVRDQGQCGSCWAFAAGAAIESKFLMAQNTPGEDLNLAEQIMVSCSSAGNCGGGYIDKASSFLRDIGTPLEECFPYTASDSNCGNACANWLSYTYNISGWRWVSMGSPTVDGLKNALYSYGPLVTTMYVYSDFYVYRSGVYSYASGSYLGGHAILLVGYDDVEQCFIAKNSWGKGWGESGYFRIAYSQLKSSVSFGKYTIAYDGQMPPPAEPDVPACSISLSSTSATVKATGGSGRVQVTVSGSSCSWQAVSNAPWIVVTSGNSGTGSKVVRFKVLRNLDMEPRTGTLSIAGKTFTVDQAGKPLRRTRNIR